MEAKITKNILGKPIGINITRRFRNRLRKVVVTDGNSEGGFELVENPDNPTEMVIPPAGICTYQDRPVAVRYTDVVNNYDDLDVFSTGINPNDHSGDDQILIGISEQKDRAPADLMLGDLVSFEGGRPLTWNNILAVVGTHDKNNAFTTIEDYRDVPAANRLGTFLPDSDLIYVGYVDSIGPTIFGVLATEIPNDPQIGDIWNVCFETPNPDRHTAQTRTYDGFIEAIEGRTELEASAGSRGVVLGHRATILIGNSDLKPTVNDRIVCDDYVGEITNIMYTAPDDSYMECAVQTK